MIMNGVMTLAPIEPEDIEKILDQHEEKFVKIDEDIAHLKTSCIVTEKRLENIERTQTNIELGQIKNRDLYQESLKSVNQAMTTTTDSLLSMNSNVNTLFSRVLEYITERDKGDSKTDINLNEGWNKREIKLAIIGGIIALLGIAFGAYQAIKIAQIERLYS
jgi:hypothetical protein